METIKVRATLKPAGIADIFHGRSIYSHKLLFVKCPINGNFKGVYTIPEFTMEPLYFTTYRELSDIQSRNSAVKKEISTGIASQVFYKLSDEHNDFDFQFKLILRTGDFFDFFLSENAIKPNVVYYARLNQHEVTGPHVMPAITDINHVKNAMNAGKLFVPSANQNFEPFKMAIAS